MRVYAIRGNAPSSFCAAQNPNKKREQVNFGGYNLHLLDGGLHADTMTHFARAIGSDISAYTKLVLHEIDLLSNNHGLKSLKSLDENLARLDTENIVKAEDFLAIPCTAPVELNSLSFHLREKLTPANIKEKKDFVVDFIRKNPDSMIIRSLDSNGQGFKYIVSIIDSINSLVKKGVNVYIPSDHPLEAAIKWKANELGLKENLYKYIAYGKDDGGKIAAIIKGLKDDNAYKFNLLTLSDAHIVNLQNRTETGDYIFSAFDSCVTDRARGVYNFYPVRDASGDIKGYSFTDRTTVQYPYNEYPDNEGIANISKFVGKKYNELDYEGNLIHIMRSLLGWEEPVNTMPDVLYPVGCYPPKRLNAEKIAEKGQYFDRTETLFFDLNANNEFIFRNCDCEGSGRPSVVSMWGSCFATVNFMVKSARSALNELFDVKIPKLLKLAKDSEEAECYPAAENILRKAVQLAKPENGEVGRKQIEYDIYTQLLELYKKQGRIEDAVKVVHEAFPNPRGGMQGAVEYKIKELRGEV